MTRRISAVLLTAALLAVGCSAEDGAHPSGTSQHAQQKATRPDGRAGDSSRPAGQATGAARLGQSRAQTAVLARLDGGSARRCVDVADGRDVRSGGFAAGPFDEARAAYRDAPGDSRTVRLYFIPERSRSMPGVTVTGRLDGGQESFRETRKESSTVEDFHFYDVDVTIPAAGRWTIRADAGPDSGCWSVRLG